MSRYDAVLFDNDGVLVEPPRKATQREATVAAFSKCGVSEVARHHVDAIVEDVSVETIKEICALVGIDSGTFWDEWERQDERSQIEKFTAGVRMCYDDVAAIEDLTQPCGIVSNNHHSTIEFILEYFELGELFETFYGREKLLTSLDRQKPNTHYIERALMDLSTRSAVYVGDSECDILAAERAGIDSVFVHRPHCEDLDLLVAPTYQISTLYDLVELCEQ